MVDGLIAYFGYGSLVNIETLRTRYVAAYPARLKGWRRHWQSRASGDAGTEGKMPALLSVHRNDDTVIDGMLIIDHSAHLRDLDEREVHYSRVNVNEDLVDLAGCSELKSIPPENRFVYVATMVDDDRSPLLQSYLDAVMQGFLNAHGQTGLSRFIETTTGFDREIIMDRDKPLYPRAVTLSSREKLSFDRLLLDAGVQFKNPD